MTPHGQAVKLQPRLKSVTEAPTLAGVKIKTVTCRPVPGTFDKELSLHEGQKQKCQFFPCWVCGPAQSEQRV